MKHLEKYKYDGTPEWRAGVEASIRTVKSRYVMVDLMVPAYKAALDEVLVFLQAMLERNSESSRTTLDQGLDIMSDDREPSMTKGELAACIRTIQNSSYNYKGPVTMDKNPTYIEEILLHMSADLSYMEILARAIPEDFIKKLEEHKDERCF